MWLFLFLLVLARTFTGAAVLDGNGTARVDRVVPEVLATLPGAAFSDPSLQDPPTALRIARAAPTSSPSDFWSRATKAEKTLQAYVPRLLQSASTYFKSDAFTDVADAMHALLEDTAAFRTRVQSALNARHVSLDALGDDVDAVFVGIADGLDKGTFPDGVPGRVERTRMVDRVLNDTAEGLEKLCARYGVEKEEVRAYVLAVTPHVKALVVAVGDVVEQHPQLLATLAFSIAALLIPESWLLRPLLSVFGFGPMGPVKGSTAALLQTRFWGATVESGSWFSLLQAAGMGVMPEWAGVVAKLPLLVGGMVIVPMIPRWCGRCRRG